MKSRCGILCEECAYRETMNCKGCANIEHPFWGNCPIKSCVEGKALTHCGQCDTFPCAMAKQFAFDEKQGDGGKRLKQCERWNEEIKG
ncbi:MAG: DUF3795 domain-containing protein [Erysipelotrichaceae bacterium]|nr:DUF3795 domain-containing protein [Erysipelotrichaceae bacterium]